MNSNNRKELAHWVVKQAVSDGADEASVDLANSRDIEIEVRKGKLDKLQESTQNSLSLSIYANHRYSSHSTNDLRRESLSRFVSEAVAMTKYLTEDEFRYLPEPKYCQGQKQIDLKINDNSYSGLTSEDRVKYATEIDAAAQAASPKVVTCTAGFSDTYYESIKVHSNGFEGSNAGTVFSAGAEATVEGKGEGRPSDWDWRTYRFRKELPSPEVFGQGAVQRALGKVGQEKIETGKYDVVIENRAASRFLGNILGPLSASSIQQKRSFLEGKLGEKIASDKFSWIDDPFVPSGLGSRLYDGEGLATKRRVIIDKGVLKSFYVDTYYGRKLGWEPTGGGTTNLVFDYGDKSLDELVAQMQRGILVTGFIGGNSNSVTGDFSAGIFGSYVENGKLVRPVNELNISGNLMEVMGQIAELGNDPWIYSAWRCPSIYLTELQISGA
ncbi:MAG: TldD/PmbA family protein [bacterium]|nr:TldD/PmbA family protein [bacterium]